MTSAVLLEGEAASLAASVRGGAIQELRAVGEGRRPETSARRFQGSPPDPTVLGPWLEAERTFHLALARASGNDLLAKTLAGLLDGFARVCYLASALGGVSPLMTEVHSALVAAVSSGDRSEARSLVVDEVRSAEALLIQSLLSSESVATTNVDATPQTRPSTFYLNVPLVATKEGNAPNDPNQYHGAR